MATIRLVCRVQIVASGMATIRLVCRVQIVVGGMATTKMEIYSPGSSWWNGYYWHPIIRGNNGY